MLIQSRDFPGFFSYIDIFTIWEYYSINYIYKCIYMPCMVCVSLWAFYALKTAKISFNLCALKFCNHALTDQQERHPEKCARIPSPEHGGRSGHQTGEAVYPEFVQYAGNPQQISANDQHAPGKYPE